MVGAFASGGPRSWSGADLGSTGPGGFINLGLQAQAGQNGWLGQPAEGDGFPSDLQDLAYAQALGPENWLTLQQLLRPSSPDFTPVLPAADGQSALSALSGPELADLWDASAKPGASDGPATDPALSPPPPSLATGAQLPPGVDPIDRSQLGADPLPQLADLFTGLPGAKPPSVANFADPSVQPPPPDSVAMGAQPVTPIEPTASTDLSSAIPSLIGATGAHALRSLSAHGRPPPAQPAAQAQQAWSDAEWRRHGWDGEKIGPPHPNQLFSTIRGDVAQGFRDATQEALHPNPVLTAVDPLSIAGNFISDPATRLVDDVQRLWRPDKQTHIEAQIGAETNARHPWWIDPSHARSPAELRAAEREIASIALSGKLPFGSGDIAIQPTGAFGRFGSADRFAEEAYARLRRFYDEEYDNVQTALRKGLIRAPQGLPEQLFVGHQTDARVMARLRQWVESEGLAEGPNEAIRINRRLYDREGSGRYRRPDLYIPDANLIHEGTLAEKTARTPQVRDYRRFSGANTMIVRPQTRGPSYGVVPRR